MSTDFNDLRHAPRLKLSRENPPEQWSDADTGEIVALSANPRLAGGVVAVPGVVERQLHESSKRDLPAGKCNFSADFLNERGVAGHGRLAGLSALPAGGEYCGRQSLKNISTAFVIPELFRA